MGHARRAIFAGFWGGMLAGVFDALATLLASVGPARPFEPLHLVAIDGGLGALAGALLVVVFVGWTWPCNARLQRSRWWSAATPWPCCWPCRSWCTTPLPLSWGAGLAHSCASAPVGALDRPWAPP
jgi:hypothetical protein